MSAHGLGKGLDALFLDTSQQSSSENLMMVNISQVEPNAAQPRKEFEITALTELTESIRTHGILQPLAVRRLAEGRYQIIAGERRWRAAREAGLNEIPVFLVDADDKTVMELALVENLQRQDLNPIEEAQGFKTLIDEFKLTQEEAAHRVGKSRPAVANSLRLLSLSPDVQHMVSDKKLSVGHAKALLTLTDTDIQLKTAKLVIEKEYNVRQTETLIKKFLQDQQSEQKELKKGISVNYLEDIERRLSSNLGRKVKLVNGRKKGRIELEYYDMGDLEKLIELLEALSR